MNKSQLVDVLAERIGDRRTAASAVDGMLDIIVDTVGSGGSVTLTGFGVFEARARAARVARNPRTGETVDVPATTVPAFRPGTGFRSSVSGNGSAGAEASGVAKPAGGGKTAKVSGSFALEKEVKQTGSGKGSKKAARKAADS